MAAVSMGRTFALTAALASLGASADYPRATLPDPVLVDALLRSSLDAEALAAAGLQAQATTALVNAVRSHLAAHPSTIETGDANYVAARTQHDVLERRVRAGLATPAEVANYAAAKATLATATTARDALLDSIFTAATQGLPSAQQTTLTTIRTNRAQRLPVVYLATSRTEAAWVALRDALATKTIAARLGEPLDAATQQTLAAIEAEPATA